MNLWLEQYKKGLEKALEKEIEMKENILSQEIKEIDYVISLAQADSEIKQILLSKIANEFKDEQAKKELYSYQDEVYEVIELAKHDNTKKALLLCAILEDEKIGLELQDHFYDYFGSIGELRGKP